VHLHSEEVYCWLTPDVVTEVQAMGWDEDKKQPISKDGLNLFTSIQSFDLEWCIAPPSSYPQTAAAVINLDNITLPSFNTATKPVTAQLGTPSATPNSVPQLVQHSLADHLDDITMALTVDTHLSAPEHTCALLPSILKKLEALSPPQTNNTVSRSTSIPAVSAALSMPGSTLGKRD